MSSAWETFTSAVVDAVHSKTFWIVVAVIAFVTTIVLIIVLGSKSRDYNCTASAGDFWQIQNFYENNILRVKNVTAGTDSVDLPYVKNDDETYDVTGEHAVDYPRFIELPGVMLILQTNKAGPEANQYANVMGVKKETLRVTMTDNPHLYYQFRKHKAGGEAGFVTFLKGSNASDDSEQKAPEGVPGDMGRNMGRVQPGSLNALYFNEGTGAEGFHHYGMGEEDRSMPIDFSKPIQNPRDHMIMLEERERELDGETEVNINTIFGTESGHFVVDTKDSSIVCFDHTRAVSTVPDLAGTYTVLYEGKDQVSYDSHDEEQGGTDLQGKASISIVQDGDDYKAVLNDGIELIIKPFYEEYNSVMNFPSQFSRLSPTPSFEGMFSARNSTDRGQAGWEELVFSVLDNSIVFRWFRYDTPSGSGGSGTPPLFSYAFGAGVRDT